MKFKVFSSGSDGNSTLLQFNNLNILIDVGLTRKCIVERLSEMNLTLAGINMVLITHEHIDHTKSIPQLLKENNIIFYMTKGTFESFKLMQRKQKKDNVVALLDEKVAQNQIRFLTRNEPQFIYDSITFDNAEIKVLPTFHDAYEPVGFVFIEGSKKLVYITDTGYVHQDLNDIIANADAYILESNHDPAILMASDRSYSLKMRILSDHGHMSNADSAMTLINTMGPNTKLVMHAHISQECNLTEVLELTRDSLFQTYGISTDGIEFVILKPSPSKEYEI